MKATRIVPLVALGALLVPSWVLPPERAWTGVLGYFGGILVTLLVLIVQALRRERRGARDAAPAGASAELASPGVHAGM